MPATSPFTKPAALTDAFAGAAEFHVPPGTASLNAVPDPAQTASVPVIGVGAGFTVTTAVATQPPLNE